MAELTPLAEIEQLVQARAKDRAFDVRAVGGDAALRALVEEEIAAWRADYSRGRRPFDLVDPMTVADRACRNLSGYGPLEPLLADDDVWEICVNAPDAVFVKRHHGLSGYHDEVLDLSLGTCFLSVANRSVVAMTTLTTCPQGREGGRHQAL